MTNVCSLRLYFIHIFVSYLSLTSKLLLIVSNNLLYVSLVGLYFEHLSGLYLHLTVEKGAATISNVLKMGTASLLPAIAAFVCAMKDLLHLVTVVRIRMQNNNQKIQPKRNKVYRLVNRHFQISNRLQFGSLQQKWPLRRNLQLALLIRHLYKVISESFRRCF